MQSPFEQKANIETSPSRGKPVILQQRDSDHAKIHVGREFQADIPELQKRGTEELREREMCVWSPTPTLNQDEETSRYVSTAKNNHGFAEEQALAFLHFHKYDVKEAFEDLRNYTHCPTQWSIEDQIAFSEAFSYAGKNFNSIQKLMPHKTLGDLVTYYYKWKKNRNVISSVMERHHREQDMNQARLLARSNTNNESDGGSSDSDCDYPRMRRYNKRRADSRQVGDSNSLKGHKRVGGNNASLDGNNTNRSRLRAPRNFHLNVDEYRNFINVTQSDTEVMIKNLVAEAKEMRGQLQNSKQKAERLSANAVDSVTPFRPPSSLRNSTSQWSRTEVFLFLEAFQRYGKEFTKLSEIIATKSTNQVESFYLSVRRRYRLDEFRIDSNGENSDSSKKQRISPEKLK